MLITCKCGSSWTGVNRAHCSACHTTFGGITSFDAHRQTDGNRSGRKCLDPVTLGLHDNGRGVWVSNYAGPDGD